MSPGQPASGRVRIRFVEEFAVHVYHFHGKDTEIIAEGIYEFGGEQPATLATGHGFGSHTWPYTIPGHGVRAVGSDL